MAGICSLVRKGGPGRGSIYLGHITVECRNYSQFPGWPVGGRGYCESVTGDDDDGKDRGRFCNIRWGSKQDQTFKVNLGGSNGSSVALSGTNTWCMDTHAPTSAMNEPGQTEYAGRQKHGRTSELVWARGEEERLGTWPERKLRPVGRGGDTAVGTDRQEVRRVDKEWRTVIWTRPIAIVDPVRKDGSRGTEEFHIEVGPWVWEQDCGGCLPKKALVVLSYLSDRPSQE
ncbi:hypothetical protein OF83DRAFT_1293420 [Amylostereum chailletii]|nr:hypothetical protein OF83DRAFT_1293420 [Amylostereum chailletii]